MSVLIGTPLDDTLTGDAGDDNTIFGDAVDSLLGGTGGDDVLTGGANSSNTIFGDVGGNMSHTRGGDDVLTGGSDATNTLVGDATGISGPSSICGNDRLSGGANSTNVMAGDTVEGLGVGVVGDDIITGGASSTNTAAGDTLGHISFSFSAAGNDVLFGGENGTNNLYGDSAGDLFAAGGGDDRIVGGSHSTNLLSGDAARVTGHPILGHSRGGNDVLIGGAFATNGMFGDAVELLASEGGNDTLIGGSDSINSIFGDAGGDLVGVANFHSPPPPKTGGDDNLTGGARSENLLVGDAGGSLLTGSGGGDDMLVGGVNSTNTLVGDARDSLLSATGGDDTLIAGDGGTNALIGDALVLAAEPDFGGSIGGDDLLLSGTGTDDMWGDAKEILGDSVGGRDVFRFLADSGDDTIHDFERGKDLIEVSASLLPVTAGAGARLAAFAAPAQSASEPLSIEERDANGDGTTDSIIHLDVDNSVTVLGVTGLTADDIVAAPGSSYVLFGRTAAPIGTRDKWLGSEGNSQVNNTPGGGFRGSAFNADTVTAAGTVLAGAGFADYAAEGILANANVAMFDLTESPLGAFATGAAADLETKIAASTPLFGGAKTDLDPAQSNIDPATGELHLAQTDADWNGIKNIEVSLDSTTSLRDIRLENFVDTRVKIGGASPVPGTPDGAVFDVALLGMKRGEVDASHAPAAIALALDIWTNTREFQNSFDIKGSVFGDVVNIGAGLVFGSTFGTPPNEFFDYFQGIYLGKFTKTFTNLGAGEDIFDSSNAVGEPLFAPFFQITDRVWGGTGDDVIHTVNGDDKLFGDNGSGANFYADPALRPLTPGADGNDVLDAGDGADFLQGDGDRGASVFAAGNVINIGASGGDQLFLGHVGFRAGQGPEDNFSDTVSYKFGDGFDVVRLFGHVVPHRTFQPGPDKVTFYTDGHTATVNELNTSEGLSTWISTVEDPSHGVLVVGVTGLMIGTDIIFT